MFLLGRGSAHGLPRLRERGLTVGVLAVLLVGCTTPAGGGDRTPASGTGATTTTATPATDGGTAPTATGGPTTSGPVDSATVPAVTLGDVGLAGVNDPGCVSGRPPVVLLHGTVSSIAVDYEVLVPALRAAGRCVFGADYGRSGTGPVRDSAVQAAAVIDEVRSITGAATVDVVGFSQGGLVLRTALRLDGAADAVGTAVLISPSFHGSTSSWVSSVPAAVCPACADQTAGSALLAELATGGDLDGEVTYAVAVTSADAVVTPWESQLPSGPPDRVHAVVVDRQCPGLVIAHQNMARSAAVVGWVVAALAAGGAVSPDALVCG